MNNHSINGFLSTDDDCISFEKAPFISEKERRSMASNRDSRKYLIKLISNARKGDKKAIEILNTKFHVSIKLIV